MKRFELSIAIMILVSTPVYAEVKVGGINHLGLTVSNLSDSEDFFVNQIGFRVLRRDTDYPSVFLRNDETMITLWQVSDDATSVKFDRKNNVGLHHVAFDVDSFEALEALHEQLQEVDKVKIEFAPENLGEGPSKHMMVYEPSGNRIEFIYRVRSFD